MPARWVKYSTSDLHGLMYNILFFPILNDFLTRSQYIAELLVWVRRKNCVLRSSRYGEERVDENDHIAREAVLGKDHAPFNWSNEDPSSP